MLGVGWIIHLCPFQSSASAPFAVLPTAMQAFADVHDTPDSPDVECCETSAVRGIDWIAHLCPFQRSTSGSIALSPTAVHASAEIHDTPLRSAKPPGAGIDWGVHLRPFQRSAKALIGLPLRPVPLRPTAMQAFGDVQDTPDSSAFGLGVDWMVHLCPFHRSARVVSESTPL